MTYIVKVMMMFSDHEEFESFKKKALDSWTATILCEPNYYDVIAEEDTREWRDEE